MLSSCSNSCCCCCKNNNQDSDTMRSTSHAMEFSIGGDNSDDIKEKDNNNNKKKIPFRIELLEILPQDRPLLFVQFRNLDSYIFRNYLYKFNYLTIIDPFSTFRCLWDSFIMLILVFTCFEIPLTLSFQIETSSLSTSYGIFVLTMDIVLCTDIILNFRTAYYDHYDSLKLVYFPFSIFLKYFKSWFLIDFLTSFPIEFMLPNSVGDLYGTPALLRAFRIVRLVRLFKLIRFFRMLKLLNTFLREFMGPKSTLFLRLAKLVAYMILAAHFSACLWYYVGKLHYIIDDDNSSWLVKFNVNINNPIDAYLTSVYWSIITLFTTGYGDIYPVNKYEQLVAGTVVLLGTCFFAYLIGAVGSIIAEGDRVRSIRISKFEEAQQFCAHKNLPIKLSRTIMTHINYFWKKNFVYDNDDVLMSLPYSIQQEILQYLNQTIFGDHFIPFNILNERTRGLLAIKLKKISNNKGHKLYTNNDCAKTFYIVRTGECALSLSNNTPPITLKRGDIFGIMGFFKGKRKGSLYCKTYCEFWSLSKRDLIEVLEDEHPKNYKKLLKSIEKSMKTYKIATKASHHKHKLSLNLDQNMAFNKRKEGKFMKYFYKEDSKTRNDKILQDAKYHNVYNNDYKENKEEELNELQTTNQSSSSSSSSAASEYSSSSASGSLCDDSLSVSESSLSENDNSYSDNSKTNKKKKKKKNQGGMKKKKIGKMGGVTRGGAGGGGGGGGGARGRGSGGGGGKIHVHKKKKDKKKDNLLVINDDDKDRLPQMIEMHSIHTHKDTNSDGIEDSKDNDQCNIVSININENIDDYGQQQDRQQHEYESVHTRSPRTPHVQLQFNDHDEDKFSIQPFQIDTIGSIGSIGTCGDIIVETKQLNLNPALNNIPTKPVPLNLNPAINNIPIPVYDNYVAVRFPTVTHNSNNLYGYHHNNTSEPNLHHLDNLSVANSPFPLSDDELIPNTNPNISSKIAPIAYNKYNNNGLAPSRRLSTTALDYYAENTLRSRSSPPKIAKSDNNSNNIPNIAIPAAAIHAIPSPRTLRRYQTLPNKTLKLLGSTNKSKQKSKSMVYSPKGVSGTNNKYNKSNIALPLDVDYKSKSFSDNDYSYDNYYTHHQQYSSDQTHHSFHSFPQQTRATQQSKKRNNNNNNVFVHPKHKQKHQSYVD